MADVSCTEMRYDAVIIGAGVAGSSAAILLARAGWSVALVEKKRFPRRKVCGECLAASNLPLLESLGIGSSAAHAAGTALQEVALLHSGDEVRAPLPRAEHARFPWGFAVGRESLDSLLLDQARSSGVDVVQPWLVQDMAGAPGGWHVQARCVESGERRTLRCGVLIDAHGSWESLAAAEKPRRCNHDLLAFKANFIDSDHRAGMISVLALRGGYGGMVVAGQGVMTIACCIRRDRLLALRRERPGMRAGLAVENWLQTENRGVRNVLLPASRSGPWLASGPLRPGIRVSRTDHILRIGNAAGEAHPILGEGMSMALQSAGLLCRQLLQHDPKAPGTTAAIAERYAVAWRSAFTQRLRLAAGFAHVAMRPPATGALVRLSRAWPRLLTNGARWGGKTRLAIDPADPGLLHARRT